MMELQFQCIHSKVNQSGQMMSRFILPSLKSGQGITIGNILRRVLLADLEGLAITGIQIEGIKHEFSTIESIREDLLEILLNLKQIVIKTNNPNITKVEAVIQVKGPGIITAKNIHFEKNEIEIINPNQYIATIVDKKEINFKLQIEKGVNFKLSNEMPHYQDETSNLIAVDAIFMPVLRVNYGVSKNYIQKNNVSEALIIEILTNGSITPENALKNACKQIVQWFEALLKTSSKNISTQIKETKNISKLTSSELILIEELQLSVRAYNCLKKLGINTLNDFKKYSKEDIKNIKNLGSKSADEIFNKLKEKFNIVIKSNTD